MRMIINLHAMAESDVFDMIPAKAFLNIKKKDPRPLFKAYVVGQEGFATPKVVGQGFQLLEWVESTIRHIVDKIQMGTKVFHDHNEDSSHTDRDTIGEVVGKGLDWIDDKISALVVAYIRPPFRDLNLDIASIEAEADIKNDYSQDIPNVLIDNITGIALGDSRIQKPAFAGATLQGQIQAFLDKSHIQGGNTMTKDQIIEMIKSGGHRPSDIFGLEELTSDSLVAGFVNTTMQDLKTKLTGEFIHRKKSEDGFTTEAEAMKKNHDEELKKRDDQIKTLQTEGTKAKVPGMFDDEAKRRKLSKRQIANIKEDLKTFSSEDPEKVDAEFATWLDGAVTKESEMAKRYGIKDPPPAKETNEEKEIREKAEAEEEEKGGIGPIERDEDKGNINKHLPTMD